MLQEIFTFLFLHTIAGFVHYMLVEPDSPELRRVPNALEDRVIFLLQFGLVIYGLVWYTEQVKNKKEGMSDEDTEG